MFSLLSCVETFKEIEIFVEQYCINRKGIEKNIYWLILMGFRIFRILNKRLYLVYRWGGPLFFWKLRNEHFSRRTIFFCIVVCKNIFFSGVIFLQTMFFMPAKNLVGLFFQDSLPPPLNLYELPMAVVQRTNLLT